MQEFRSFSIDPEEPTPVPGGSHYPPDPSEDDDLAETIEASLAVQVDEVSDTVTYVGKAIPGTDTSAGLWQIQRLTEPAVGDLVVEWANGAATFDKIWDDRLGYSYF